MLRDRLRRKDSKLRRRRLWLLPSVVPFPFPSLQLRVLLSVALLPLLPFSLASLPGLAILDLLPTLSYPRL